MLGSCHNGLSKILQATYTLGGEKKRFSGLHVSYTHGGGQNGLPNFYETPTRLGMVTTECPNFYMSPARLAVVKWTFPTSTSLAAVKTEPPNFQKTAYALGGGRNGLSVLLLASHMLGGGQNGLSELLRASYSRIDYQNGLSQLLQALCTLAGCQN